MGVMGHYIDMLPAPAKDRLIEAQDWCVAEVNGPGGARCLVGHAEDWLPVPSEHAWWRRWMDDECGAQAGEEAELPPETDIDTLCRPELFAFRRAGPADMEVYRARLLRWGPTSEGRIGSRFDRLCVRRGCDGAVRLIKARAARGFAPGRPARAHGRGEPLPGWVARAGVDG